MYKWDFFFFTSQPCILFIYFLHSFLTGALIYSLECTIQYSPPNYAPTPTNYLYDSFQTYIFSLGSALEYIFIRCQRLIVADLCHKNCSVLSYLPFSCYGGLYWLWKSQVRVLWVQFLCVHMESVIKVTKFAPFRLSKKWLFMTINDWWSPEGSRFNNKIHIRFRK